LWLEKSDKPQGSVNSAIHAQRNKPLVNVDAADNTRSN